MKVLVAEDERATRARIVACLREFGHDPVEAANGLEAWNLAQAQEIPIVISDWLMPEMDGPTLVRRLRSQPQSSYVYVILLTSRAETQDVVAGMDAGADDFMSKPFDKEELRARIRAGERVIQLERDLEEKNRSLFEANAQISAVNRRMKSELLSAARIQQSYLPSRVPTCPHAEFAWLYEPCDELGGDTLNVIPFSDYQYGLYVIDVSGHGVSAALLSVNLSRALTRQNASTTLLHGPPDSDGVALTSPRDVAAMLNTRFQTDPSNNQYFTFLYGILDLHELTFRYTSAGHPGPLVLGDDETLIAEAMPPAVGFFPDPEFQENTLSLRSNDRLYLYTDGIFEVDNDRGDEWGERGLAVAAKLTSHLPIAENLRAIRDAAKSWQNHSPMQDDVSLIGIQLS